MADDYITKPKVINFEETLLDLNPEMNYTYSGDSPVFKIIKVKDIFTDKPNNKTRLDALSYQILTVNNIYMHIQGIYFVTVWPFHPTTRRVALLRWHSSITPGQ